MSRSSPIRIDPWSRWANFTMDSWEWWFDACLKRGIADAPRKAAGLATLSSSPQVRTRAHQPVAQR